MPLMGTLSFVAGGSLITVDFHTRRLADGVRGVRGFSSLVVSAFSGCFRGVQLASVVLG